MLKTKRGITLIVLIITIIVLLVLAGITINMVLGENGLFNKAKTSVAKYENAQEKENSSLDKYEELISIFSGTRDMSKDEIKSIIREVLQEDFGSPVGEIIAQMGKTAPEGYLVCDGKDDYLISDYQKLADYIEEQFGTKNYFGGDGTTTFGVPDLRGEFLRGTGTATRNTGTGEEVGIHQDATYHNLIWPGSNYLRAYYNNTFKNEYNEIVAQNRDLIINGEGKSRLHNASTSDVGESSGNSQFYTSRPTNTSVLYCIKY